jgi:HEAT repeat protein
VLIIRRLTGDVSPYLPLAFARLLGILAHPARARWVGALFACGALAAFSGAAETGRNARSEPARERVTPPELDDALRHLETYTWSQSREPLNAIEKVIQNSAGDVPARKQLANRLAAVLRSGAPFPAKQYVCRKLSQIGTADSIPALAPLLVDPALSHAARFALERIEDPRAAEALRRALPQAAGPAKVGIINSLGAMKDPAAVSILTALLADADASIAEASVAALGRIDPKDHSAVVPALQQALRASASPEVREQARRLLRRWGINPD